MVLAGDSVDLYNPKVVRSTTGSLFHLPIAVDQDLVETLARAHEAGLQVSGQYDRDYFLSIYFREPEGVLFEIATLSPKLRDVLLLAVTGEHRYEDIASLLGVPTGTVKWRMNEARRQLAERLER